MVWRKLSASRTCVGSTERIAANVQLRRANERAERLVATLDDEVGAGRERRLGRARRGRKCKMPAVGLVDDQRHAARVANVGDAPSSLAARP